MIAFDEPGTTRDAIYLDFERDGRRYTLIDTAGMRRRGKVFEAVEKFSVIKTLQAIEDANVVVLLLDAQHGITEQDAHIAGYILEAGRALVVARQQVGRRADAEQRDERQARPRAQARLPRVRARITSSRRARARGIDALLQSVDEAYAAAMAKLPTPRLTRALQQAVERQQPPRAGLVRPKLRYAHQGGVNPPLDRHPRHRRCGTCPDAYRRYLEHFFTRGVPTAGHAA